MTADHRQILVTGAAGMLGSSVIDQLLANSHNMITGVTRNRPLRVKHDRLSCINLDLTDAQAVHESLGSRDFDVVIHCAALINLDQCERDIAAATSSNVSATKFLIDATHLRNTPQFVYISSDAVYPDRPGFKPETLATAPTSLYGLSKLWGEQVVALYAPRHLVFRTTIVGPDPGQFFAWIMKHALANQEVPLFRDVFFTPISVRLTAAKIDAALTEDISGIFNLGSSDVMSKADFGKAILHQVNPDCPVRLTSLAEMPSKIRRSYNMALDSSLLARKIGPMPTVAESVADVLNHFEISRQ